MPLALQNMKPYVSLLVCQVVDKTPSDKLLVGLQKEIVALIKQRDGVSKLTGGGKPQGSGSLTASFFHYIESKQPSWTDSAAVKDTLNQLVLMCTNSCYAAVYCSDSLVRELIRRRLNTKDNTVLGSLLPLSSGCLSAAFVRGPAQTLWLSGAHRRIASKADSKVLSGTDLAYALDPLEDQSYFFTAARSRVDNLAKPMIVGASPRKSSLWTGVSPSWKAFRETVEILFEALGKVTAPSVNPLPVLATEVDDPTSIKEPYDAAVIPPELIELPHGDQQREEADRWSRLRFAITATSGTDFTAELYLNENGAEKAIGTVEAIFDLAGSHARPKLKGKPAKGTDEILKAALGAISSHPAWLKVWYDTGHVIADGAVFLPRYRDFAFTGYEWRDFKGFNVQREKPSPLDAKTIGGQDSLFCWVHKHWRMPGHKPTAPQGWLACDDGSMEIADFVNVDCAAKVIALIHAKASHSAATDREVSVSDYEIVVGQAVKNIRYCDSCNLTRGLKDGLAKKMNGATWSDGKYIGNRKPMLQALDKMGADYRRVVVILQPRATWSAMQAARAKPTSQAFRRVQQLDTLLLSAQSNCQAVGAQLIVIGDQG